MKIGLDLSLSCGHKSGVGTYSYNLAANLAQIDKENFYTLFPFFFNIFDPEFKKLPLPENSGNMRFYLQNMPKSLIEYFFKRAWISHEYFLKNLDLIHSTSFAPIPEKFKGKVVATIYDLTFVKFPEYHTPQNIEICLHGTKELIKKADKLIAISEKTKMDLIRHFNVNPKKIDVIYLGYDKEIFKPNLAETFLNETKQKFGLNKPFILNVGTIEPRKNNLGLLKAWQLCDKKIRDQYDLCFTGEKGWLSNEFYDYITKNNINVKFLGYTETKDLAALYNLASIFVYPSFYEGFGLPVLEAMACGCPVITSKTSSLPEVGGKAVEYINPNKPEELGIKIEYLLKNTEKRQELSQKGMEQSAKFSWDLCARQTLTLYQKLVQ